MCERYYKLYICILARYVDMRLRALYEVLYHT